MKLVTLSLSGYREIIILTTILATDQCSPTTVLFLCQGALTLANFGAVSVSLAAVQRAADTYPPTI